MIRLARVASSGDGSGSGAISGAMAKEPLWRVAGGVLACVVVAGGVCGVSGRIRYTARRPACRRSTRPDVTRRFSVRADMSRASQVSSFVRHSVACVAGGVCRPLSGVRGVLSSIGPSNRSGSDPPTGQVDGKKATRNRQNRQLHFVYTSNPTEENKYKTKNGRPDIVTNQGLGKLGNIIGLPGHSRARVDDQPMPQEVRQGHLWRVADR